MTGIPHPNDYATHQRFLLRALLNTNGPILELGCGWFSTPLIHEVGINQGRYILSQDNDPSWFKDIRGTFYVPYKHEFECPINRGSWEQQRRWSVAFVDHGPTPETPRNDKGLLNSLDRAVAVTDLIDAVDVFVLHDTQLLVRWEYDWDKVLSLFKYSITDETCTVHTTIASNTIDVAKW